MERWRNPGDQEKVEVVEQLLAMKSQVGPRCPGWDCP